jgi:hypothetical protein
MYDHHFDDTTKSTPNNKKHTYINAHYVQMI